MQSDLLYRVERLHRRSVRLKDFDYSQPGSYFVTICSWRRVCSFGRIELGSMRPTVLGELIRCEWENTLNSRVRLTPDEYVLMPNHFHAVVCIKGDKSRIQNGSGPTETRLFGRPQSDSLPTIIGLLKSSVTSKFRKQSGDNEAQIWQRGFYEHVVRSERELFDIRTYIKDNPLKWQLDQYYSTG